MILLSPVPSDCPAGSSANTPGLCSLQVELEPDEPPVVLGCWFGAPAVGERVDQVEAAAAGAAGRVVELRVG